MKPSFQCSAITVNFLQELSVDVFVVESADCLQVVFNVLEAVAANCLLDLLLSLDPVFGSGPAGFRVSADHAVR